jgi:5-oxoprolinase (ATP-hydrolysing)
LIHKYSSVLSAYGMALADVVQEARKPASLLYSQQDDKSLEVEFESLEEEACGVLRDQGITSSRIVSERYLNMRFHGSDTPLMIREKSGSSFLKCFRDAHQQQFGFLPVGRDVIIDDFRVRAIGQSVDELPASPIAELESLKSTVVPKSTTRLPVYFKSIGWVDTPIYKLNDLVAGIRITGPSLIIDDKQTLVISTDATATILTQTVVIDINSTRTESVSADTVDPIQLSIFGHRFMGIAEQAGRALQKTAVSTNIKERLDFSCTIFSPDGGLVANAPHVPAMIGSMAYAVRWQIERWGSNLRPGDVILSNSPIAGGTHLPDLTVITPVFDELGKKIVFWTASRGHHADIGGTLPGSMPPNSKELWEEGAVIESFKVVENGIFKEEELTKLLMAPAAIPGCSGSRCLKDNISDIKAQAAANHRSSQLLHSLIEEYSLSTVQFYMEEIQSAAETAVRNLLKTIASRNSGVLNAVDYMDDGTPIALKVTIDKITGSAIFDFNGTGPEAYGNWNAPVAIVNSAIIFALRCMVDQELPLNQGAIRPITVELPENSLLMPSAEAACCAGNVLTSQRIVDVIFKAFSACAASQGCKFRQIMKHAS